MVTIQLKEGVTSVLPLTATEVASLSELTLVEIVPTRIVGTYSVTPSRNKVGVAARGGVEVIVEPKVPITQLVFMLDYYRTGSPWNSDEVHLAGAVDMTNLIAKSFAMFASRAIERVVKGYRPVSDCLPVLRGRLNVSRQITKHMGIPVPLEVDYEDFSVDVTDNQLILEATRACLRFPLLHPATKRSLQSIRARLELLGVTRTTARQTWHATRLNSHYHGALRLADVVLRNQSATLSSGFLRTHGFVVDMYQVFEDFVTNVLDREISSFHLTTKSQDPIRLDVKHDFKSRADLTVRTAGGEVIAIVDVKYKNWTRNRPPIEDVYQVNSYCVATGAPDGYLIYVGTMEDRSFMMSNSGLRIHCLSIDLNLGQVDLMERLSVIARLVVQGLPVVQLAQ